MAICYAVQPDSGLRTTGFKVSSRLHSTEAAYERRLPHAAPLPYLIGQQRNITDYAYNLGRICTGKVDFLTE